MAGITDGTIIFDLWYYPITDDGELTGDDASEAYLPADVQRWLGTTAQGASGRPQVDVELIEGADPSDTIRDAVVDDATRIDASQLNTHSAITIAIVAAAPVGATGNDTTHIHIPGLTQGNDELNSLLLVILDDTTGEYHSRWIEDWVLATELATVATLPFTPEQTNDLVWIFPTRADSGLRVIEGALTNDDLLRISAAALAGKVSGAETTTVTIRDVNDTRNAIVATVDADGNRSALTLDPS